MDIDTAALKRVAIEAGKAGLPFIEQALTAVLTGVSGPFGMLVGPALNLLFPQINAALGLDPDTSPDQTADRIASDPAAAQVALDTLDKEQQFSLAQQKQVDDTRLASQAQQTALIALDTSSQSRVQRWWRPAIGWGLGALMMLSFSLPFVVWGALVCGWKMPDPPRIDEQALMILAGLLGLTVATRSVDKGTTASAVKAIVAAPKLAVRR